MTELLKQDQYEPLAVERQVLIIFAGTNGFLNELPVTDCRRYEQELFNHMDAHHASTS